MKRDREPGAGDRGKQGSPADLDYKASQEVSCRIK
jgi:hypothetical protein